MDDENKKVGYLCVRGHIEDAIYSKPLLDYDDDNIFIKALPPALSRDEVVSKYFKTFPQKPDATAPTDVQLAQIQLFSEARLPLPHIRDLEEKFRNCLINSYRKRLCTLKKSNATIYVKDTEVMQHLETDSSFDGDGDTGMALVGIGGSGKTCSINTLLSTYPQTIRHRTTDGTFLQVCWIKIEPSSNNDLATLFDSFGYALDRALCNSNPVYGPMIRKRRKLGEKANVICDLVKLFSIGIIIIDEIQRLEFNKNRAESYENIMTITNNTKVALMVAGTEEAYGLFFNKYYTLRRVGDVISTTVYCSDRKNFNLLAGMVMDINWFRTPQIIQDKTIMDAMFTETSGTISRIIGVWKEVQREYVRLSDEEKQNFVLTPDFIYNSSKSIQHYIASQTRDAVANDLSIRKAVNVDDIAVQPSVNGDLNEKVLSAEKRIQIHKKLSELVRSDCAIRIFGRALNNINEAGKKYTEEMIADVVVQVMKSKQGLILSEDVLLTKTLQKLNRKKQVRHPKVKDSGPADLTLNVLRPDEIKTLGETE